MKLSEVLDSLEQLGIEVNNNLMRVEIDAKSVKATYLARDEKGRAFESGDKELATNTVSHRIEDDLWIQDSTTKSPADRVGDAKQRSK